MNEFSWNYKATAHTIMADILDLTGLLYTIKNSNDKLEVVTAVDVVKNILSESINKMDRVLKEVQEKDFTV